ncbi:hypothetical protein AVEN_57323-1 [Araneus ventricosus]|uniref:Uncharacterized protein n=1 Tax=Araneus ventricosus TaxID=182803 RepID=A0A4Y2INT1_ARAVE|nr:hypothetical protein AVEN_57323-1 [Araneus ventricosus]
MIQLAPYIVPKCFVADSQAHPNLKHLNSFDVPAAGGTNRSLFRRRTRAIRRPKMVWMSFRSTDLLIRLQGRQCQGLRPLDLLLHTRDGIFDIGNGCVSRFA